MAEKTAESEYGQELDVDAVIQSIAYNKEWWWARLQKLMIDSGSSKVRDFTRDALELYRNLEQVALDPPDHFPGTPEEAAKIKALWVISAAGTYFKGSKKDRYEDKPWAAWNDRQRINYALRIGRRLAEVKLGRKISDNWVKTERELDREGPLVVYSGRPDEDTALLEAAAAPWLFFPENNAYPKAKILVINSTPPIDNLLDQIKTFKLPKDFQIEQGDEIGVVIHAPQAVRFLYMFKYFQGIVPNGAAIRIFPLPTPKIGIPEYPLQELRGLVYYRFIANPPVAAATPYPHNTGAP